MIEQTWKPCQICPKYEVSDLGAVRNSKTGRVLTPYKQNRGYLQVNLSDATKSHKPTVHRLVALAFIGASDLEVNHKDMDKTNNAVLNLEYVTRKQNQRHAADNLRWSAHNPHAAKLSEQDVLQIRELSASGSGYGKLAKMFNVDKSNIAAIVKRRSWTHI